MVSVCEAEEGLGTDVKEQRQLVTVDDLAMMTGLGRKEILKKMRKKGAVILMFEDEAEQILRKHMPKG